jgi:hypothetical protein
MKKQNNQLISKIFIALLILAAINLRKKITANTPIVSSNCSGTLKMRRWQN